MAKAGLIKTIHPEKIAPNLLIETVFANLTSAESPTKSVHLDFLGLPRVADYLSMLMFDSFNIQRLPVNLRLA